MQSMLDDPPGFRQCWSGDYHDAMPDEAVNVFLAAGSALPSPLTQHLMFPRGGAVSSVAEDATPLSRRKAAWVTHPFATWLSPADDAVNINWVRDYRAAIAPYTNGGTYLNFIGDEGQERIAAAFGPAQPGPAARDQRRVRPEQCLRRQPEHPPTRAGLSHHAQWSKQRPGRCGSRLSFRHTVTVLVCSTRRPCKSAAVPK
jgi:hypothetical protein